MKLISHRGNINGVNAEKENTLDYIDSTLEMGYDVEVDVRTGPDGKFYTGHDQPQHEVELVWLRERSESLWIHCKDFKTLSALIKWNLKVFYHEKEDYAIISNGLIWAHNLNEVDRNCIIPLLSKEDIDNRPVNEVWGICSDYVGLL